MEQRISNLVDKDADVRMQARRALIAAGRQSTSSLLEGLGAEDPKLRQACIGVLRELKDETAIEVLKVAATKDSAWMVRNTAIAALADSYAGRKSIATLTEIAEKDADWINRNDAIKALSKILASESVPILKRLLTHSDAHTKVAAARELGVHGDAGGLEAATKGLQHTDRRVREKAASALRAIGSPLAVAALQRRIDDPNEDFRVKEVALGAIRHIDMVAQPPDERTAILNAALEDDDRIVRSWAISELVAAGGPDARNVFERVAHTPGHPAAKQAAQALQMIAQEHE